MPNIALGAQQDDVVAGLRQKPAISVTNHRQNLHQKTVDVSNRSERIMGHQNL